MFSRPPPFCDLRNGNDVREVLPLLHQAALCPRFGNHYEPYRHRVMALAEKAGLGPYETMFLKDFFPLHSSVRDMWKDCLSIAQRKFVDGHTDEGVAISDALNGLFYAFDWRYVNPLSYMNGGHPLQTTGSWSFATPP